jgi:hypothetical protein
MPKTSDLESATDQKASNKPKYLSPAELAKLVGPLKGRPGSKRKNCSERTIREWCKQGQIPEAHRTSGGHWRISMPLSGKTRLELEKRCRDWPFEEGAGDLQGNWEPDLAEWLLLAQLYQRDVDQDVPVPALAELADLLQQRLLEEEPTDENERRARQIQSEIIRRLEIGKPFWDLLVLGWVYEFSRRNRRCPTVEEVADLMRLSRPALYRRSCNADKINDAYLRAIREFRRELRDPSGLDSVQKQNKEAKNRGSGRVDLGRLDRALFLKGS